MKDLKSKVLQLGAAAMLTRSQLKNVQGGNIAACLPLGAACTGSVQCCSNICKVIGGGTTGAICSQTA